MENNLETLLKYQNIDIKLRRALDSLEKSDANKKMEQARTEFNSAKKTVQDSEKEAENIVSSYEQSAPQFKEIADKLSELELIIENAEEGDDLGELAEQLEALKNKVASFEKRLAEYKTTSEKLVKSYQDANAIGLKMRGYYNNAKADYTELIKASEPEVNTLKKQLKELEGQIDPETMAKYKAITADNKYPAFVEVHVSDGVYSCRGCGLQLSQKNTSTLNENGTCTCETCRRIIYKG
ncbi:MAG: hypothetical protein J1F36_01510 [Clostridiales bacterium]|nr:hypothetical protein [Clostridiales bacterium]